MNIRPKTIRRLVALRPTRLLPPKRLLTPRSARHLSATNRGLLPGSPAITRTGLSPAGLVQLPGRNIWGTVAAAMVTTVLFHNRTSNLGLVTQNVQWLILMGTAFVVSAYLQVVRGYNAIETGVIFTAATAGILVTSLAAERLAKKYPQRTLILAGFVVALLGIGVLLTLVKSSPSAWAFAPGLLFIGLGLGTML